MLAAARLRPGPQCWPGAEPPEPPRGGSGCSTTLGHLRRGPRPQCWPGGATPRTPPMACGPRDSVAGALALPARGTAPGEPHTQAHVGCDPAMAPPAACCGAVTGQVKVAARVREAVESPACLSLVSA